MNVSLMLYGIVADVEVGLGLCRGHVERTPGAFFRVQSEQARWEVVVETG